MKDKDSRLLTERYHLIKEGMSAWPTKKGELPGGQIVFMPVFSPEMSDRTHGQPHYHLDKLYAATWRHKPGTPEHTQAEQDYDNAVSGKSNPHYRPDLDMHLSNVNAINVMKALEPYIVMHGKKLSLDVKIHHEDYHYSVPIDVFIAGCKGYLANSVGVDEPAIPSHIEPRHLKKTSDVIDMATGDKVPGKMEPKGPTMIHGGRDENYTKNRVMQLLHIAVEGKNMGAEQMSIG